MFMALNLLSVTFNQILLTFKPSLPPKKRNLIITFNSRLTYTQLHKINICLGLSYLHLFILNVQGDEC